MFDIPPEINDTIINAIANENDKNFVRKCYVENGEGCYSLRDGLSHDDKFRLRIILEIVIRMIYLKILTHVKMIARWISIHRIKCDRIGDCIDDYSKAEYLYSLNLYLIEKNAPHYSLSSNDTETEEIIDIVNSIFDHAYFLNKNHSNRSDIACFTEAEREFCNEKAFEYLAYFEYLNRIQHNLPGNEITDYHNAQKKHKEQQIDQIAYFEYQNRSMKNLPGNAETDHYIAEKKYDDWKITKKIAVSCWNISTNKNLSQGHYWGLAEQVIEKLKISNYSYKEKHPSCDKRILDTIREIVR